MAVPGRRGSVPTDPVTWTRDVPLPWDSGSGTPRVLSRKLRFSTPVLEPPGSDMIIELCMDEWARGRFRYGPRPNPSAQG